MTRWTEATELFAEYPPLVAGEVSRFAIHLTRLDTFAAVVEGRVDVELRDGLDVETFSVDGPSRPGIFGVDVRPSQPGVRELVVVLQAPGVTDEHQVGAVEVHASVEDALAAPAGEEAEGISFLKEQQWNLDFGTAVVSEGSVRQSIRVPARIETRPGGAADVAAPIDGRLTAVFGGTIGVSVTRGQELARLLPPPADPAQLPELDRARAEASSALALATRDRERAERLTAVGAVPQKRLDEALATEEQAQARMAAADAALAQYQAVRGGGSSESQSVFVVQAPVSGVLAWRDATSGTNVTRGTRLFRIADASQVHVVGHVPEAEAMTARLAAEAEIEIPTEPDRVAAGRLVGVGRVLDPDLRTLPVTFALDNSTLGLPVGQPVFLHLLMDATAPGPVVPASAVVDDAGRPIVFVQLGGETFERRPVTLGARSGDIVRVTSGLEVGERVVTTGAYLVRLASLSTSVPAHGHVH